MSRPIIGLLAAMAVAVALVLIMAGPAHAQAECTTISGYQVCEEPSADVLGANVSRAQSSGTLPVTGNDPSKFVVAGAAFVIMGGAALAGSRRSRRTER